MKHPLSVADVARALAASEGETNAIIETLYASGARVSELVKLTWGDVNLETATVRLQGKKGDERCVPIGQPCLAALYALHNGSQGHPRGEARVFNLNEQAIRDRLKTVGRRIGLHLTPHLFRHAFASHLHNNGASERVIMDMLGHRRVDTTMIYLDISDRTIQERCDLITRAMANIRGRGDDPRSLKHVIVDGGAGLVLR
jgi:integrase/recombinase XerD